MRCLASGLLTVLALALCADAAGAADSRREPIGDGLVAVLAGEGHVELEASPQRGEGLLAFAERLCGTRDAAQRIRELNGNARQLLAGVRYRIDFPCLQPALQRRVMLGLFPDDTPEAEGWSHVVRSENGGLPVSLWRIAEWFTGNGQNFPEIRDANGFDDEVLQAGQRVLVPRGLLLPGLRATLGPAPTRTSRRAVDLEYGSDGAGEYAIYRLKPGEALYTSVVVRLTGHLAAVDVNRLAGEIAERSGIVDVTDIPVGYRVKVPFDLLLPEFLPEGNPRRLEWQANLEASDRFSNQVQALDLAGITVILDAGHGGADVGASMSGVWESLYVYDIMARVRQLFLETTAAEVKATTRDGDSWSYSSRDVLPYSKGHVVLTDPPYRIEQGAVGTNLRWYLANSLYEQSLRQSADGEKTIFISIHADSLHPSLRGAMVYVPGLLPNPKSHGKSGAIYTSRREVREQPRVSFPWGDRVKSLGLSRELADQLLESFSTRGLRVHDNHPVRDRVRKGRGVEYVPAVLRYNAVPAKVLLEVCNLANDEDRRLLQTESYRQRVAEAIVDGVLRYYGYPERRRSRQIVASSGG